MVTNTSNAANMPAAEGLPSLNRHKPDYEGLTGNLHRVVQLVLDKLMDTPCEHGTDRTDSSNYLLPVRDFEQIVSVLIFTRDAVEGEISKAGDVL